MTISTRIFTDEAYLGRLDQPTIIPLDSLQNFYCPEEEIPSVLKGLRTQVQTRMGAETIEWVNTHDIEYYSYYPFEKSLSKCMETFDDRFSIQSPLRTSLVRHPDLTGRICKVYEAAPGTAHHMANTLRVPMAHKINHFVREFGFTLTDAPHKQLVPLYDHAFIMQLNEGVINEAYIPLVEERVIRMDFPDDLISHQGEMAEQICTIISLTGLGDAGWGTNIVLTDKDGSTRATFIDTEPLYGEMCVDSETSGKFYRNASFISNRTLRKCATTGLKNFGISSSQVGLQSFDDVAQRFLEKL